MWALLLWLSGACKVVEPPHKQVAPPKAKVVKEAPAAVQVPLREMPVVIDPLGMPVETDVKTGEHRLERPVVEVLGDITLSRVTLGGGVALVARNEGKSTELDVDSVRYRREIRGGAVVEALTILKSPMASGTLERLKEVRGMLIPPAFYAIIAGDTKIAASEGEVPLVLHGTTPVQVLYWMKNGQARVLLAGREVTVDRALVTVLPAHVLMDPPPPDYVGDPDIPLLLTSLSGSNGNLKANDGTVLQIDVGHLKSLRLDSPRVLGDLPPDGWLWVSEGSAAHRVVLLEGVVVHGLALARGTVVEIGEEGALEAVDIDEAKVMGGRRLAPGTRLLMGGSCDFREQRVDFGEACLEVVGGKLLERK